MYYGGLDGLSMDDLAANEQASQGVVTPGDITAIGQAGANVGQMYAQYEMAKAGILPQQQQQQIALQLQQQQANSALLQKNAAGGWSTGTKVAVAIGVGAVALGALVWIAGARKRSKNSGLKSLWRTIGE